MSWPVYSGDRDLNMHSNRESMLICYTPFGLFSFIFDTILVFVAFWPSSLSETYPLISVFQTHFVPLEVLQ